MADKSRQKETEELLPQAGKARADVVSEGGSPQHGEGAERDERSALISSLFDVPEQQPAAERKGRGRTPVKEPKVDRRPLNFGKYGLPGDGEPPEAEPESPPRRQKAAQQPEVDPRQHSPRKGSGRQPAQGRQEPQPEQQVPSEEGGVVQPFVFEDFELPAPRGEEPKIVRASAKQTEGAPIKPQKPKSAPAQENGPAEQSPRRKSKPPTPGRNPEGERDNILRELSSQFDEAFSEAFDGSERPEAEVKSQRAEVSKGRSDISSERLATSKKAELSRGKPVRSFLELEDIPPSQQLDNTEDPTLDQLNAKDIQAEQEADSFLQEFAQRVHQEEEARTELFKDTLAQKFERERTRYLRELGIDENSPPPREDKGQMTEVRKGRPDLSEVSFTPPATRRLDVQIDPEMHTPKVAQRPAERPVTYSRQGQLRDLDRQAIPAPTQPAAKKPAKTTPAPAPKSNGKKTTEDLLLELAVQKTESSIRPAHRPPPRQMEGVADVSARLAPIVESFTEPPKTGLFGRGKRRALTLAGVAAAVVLVPLGLLITSNMRSPAVMENVPLPPFLSESRGGDTLEVFENRNFEGQRGEFENVYIRRANVSVRNVSVDNILLIEGIDSPGEVRLEDVSVDGSIQLRGSGVSDLNLHNVSAERLVISNDRADAIVNISGASGIGTVEIQTPAGVSVIPTQGADLSRGIGSIRLSAAPHVQVLSVTLNGVETLALESEGEAILELGPGSLVERLSSRGPISVRGEGRVQSFFAGPAEKGDHSTMLRLDLDISHMALTGPVDLVLYGAVDSMTAAERLTLSGTGSVSHLMLNEPVTRGRLPLSVGDGVTVGALIANAELLLQVGGAGRVNELTANRSVHAMGNRLNLLVVNADNVIYESEPDAIQVAPGVHPPSTVADNPNLNFAIATEQLTGPIDTSEDEVSTVCGHPRSTGGFLLGDGSRQNPYQVATPAQLAHVGMHLSSHFVQTGDIDLSTDATFIAGFPMIGSAGSPFTGSFDGQGYAIRNLRVDSGDQSVGLFAESSGEIINVSLTSGEVRATSAGSGFVGGILGRNLEGGLVAVSSNGARVIGGPGFNVGGIAGQSAGRIRDCYSAATITGTSNVGGLVGLNAAGATLSGSYNAGGIEAVGDGVGAVAGVNRGIVTNTYYLEGSFPYGIGEGEGSAMVRTAEAMGSAQMVADLTAGSDTSPWARSQSEGYLFPVLRRP